MVSACPESPDAKFAGARCGAQGTFAVGGIETPPNWPGGRTQRSSAQRVGWVERLRHPSPRRPIVCRACGFSGADIRPETRNQRRTAPYRRSRAARHSRNSSKSFLRASTEAGTASRRSVRNRLNSLAFVRRGRSAPYPLPATSIARPNPVRSAPTRLSATSEHIAEHSFPSKN